MAEREGAAEKLNSFEAFKKDVLGFLFMNISPMRALRGNPGEIVIVDHNFTPPDQTVQECIESGSTFGSSLRIKTYLIVTETGEVKEQELYMGRFPEMTLRGTFVIEGEERAPIAKPYETLEEEIRKGLTRMSLTARGRLTRVEPEAATPSGLISTRAFTGSVRRAFAKITLPQRSTA
jgi:DNA-directed RNA polymerase beta subunit